MNSLSPLQGVWGFSILRLFLFLQFAPVKKNINNEPGCFEQCPAIRNRF